MRGFICERSLYNLYIGLDTDWKWDSKHYMVVSCDPGVKNFAMRIEKRETDKITSVVIDKIDLTDTKERSRYEQLYDFLESYNHYFIKTHIFIIERQLPKNFDASRIAQHAISYFIRMKKLSEIKNPVVMDISPKVKGYQLTAPKKCKEYWLKKWAVLRAAQLFKARGDDYAYSMLQEYKKKDDISDTAIQIEAVFRMLKLPLTCNFDHDHCIEMEEVKTTERPKVPVKPKVTKPKIPKETKPKIPKETKPKIPKETKPKIPKETKPKGIKPKVINKTTS
jgi:Poxvirus A22 protein